MKQKKPASMKAGEKQVSPHAQSDALASAARQPTVAWVAKAKSQPLVENVAVVEPEVKFFKGRRIPVTQYQSYLVGNKIGEGGMAQVYQADVEVHKEDGSVSIVDVVAIKFILFQEENPGSDPAALKKSRASRKLKIERFVEEFTLVSMLKHENIIQLKIIGKMPYEEENEGTPKGKGALKEIEQIPYFSMELLKGKTLDQVLEIEGPMTWARLKPIIMQVCKALRAAHEYKNSKGKEVQIVHLDIKAPNIFIENYDAENPGSAEEKVKVLDFGLAKTMTQKTGTDEMIAAFSPGYMAPEQGLFKETDPRTDIYSVGAVMYLMLSGKPPFIYRGDVESHINEIATVPPESLIGKEIEIPEKVEEMILKCLEKEPRDRFQSMKELIDAIEECDAVDERDIGTAIIPMPRPPEPWEVQIHQYGGIPDGPIRAERTDVDTFKPEEPGTGRFGRKLLYGLIGAIALAAGGTISALMSTKGKEKARKPAQASIVADASSKRPFPRNLPLAKPALDGSVPDKEQEAKEFRIVIKTNVPGVRFLLDDKPDDKLEGRQICKGEDICEFKMPKSKSPVLVTLEKEGHIRRKKYFVPDSDKELYIEMRRRARRAPATKRVGVFIFRSDKPKKPGRNKPKIIFK